MVDPSSRRLAAEILRQFTGGRLTNDELEDRWPRSLDPAIAVVREAAWFLYSDLRENRLSGPDRLPASVRKQVVRWVLFLHTDLPYEWPVPSPAQNLARQLVSLLTLGVSARLWAGRLSARGVVGVWPFIRGADFRAALRRPRLLRGGLTARTRGQDRVLLDEMRVIVERSDRTYGSPRLYYALVRRGYAVSHRRVERLMRQAQWRARVVRVYRRTGGP